MRSADENNISKMEERYLVPCRGVCETRDRSGVGLVFAGGIRRNLLASLHTSGIVSLLRLDFHTRGSNHQVYVA